MALPRSNGYPGYPGPGQLKPGFRRLISEGTHCPQSIPYDYYDSTMSPTLGTRSLMQPDASCLGHSCEIASRYLPEYKCVSRCHRKIPELCWRKLAIGIHNIRITCVSQTDVINNNRSMQMIRVCKTIDRFRYSRHFVSGYPGTGVPWVLTKPLGWTTSTIEAQPFRGYLAQVNENDRFQDEERGCCQNCALF